jgi:hypothetical protein
MFNMDGYDTRRVMEDALEKLNNPKAWLILAGSVAGIYFLNQKGILRMDGYDTRRTLEKLIDKMGD